MSLARNPSLLKTSVGRRGQTARQASARGTEACQPSSPRENDMVSFPFPTQTLLTWTSLDSPQELSCLLTMPPGLGLEAFTSKGRPPCNPSDKSVIVFLSPRDTCPRGWMIRALRARAPHYVVRPAALSLVLSGCPWLPWPQGWQGRCVAPPQTCSSQSSLQRGYPYLQGKEPRLMLQVHHPSTGQGLGVTHYPRGAQGRSLVQVGELMCASESKKTPAFPVLLLCYLMTVLSLFISFPPSFPIPSLSSFPLPFLLSFPPLSFPPFSLPPSSLFFPLSFPPSLPPPFFSSLLPPLLPPSLPLFILPPLPFLPPPFLPPFIFLLDHNVPL